MKSALQLGGRLRAGEVESRRVAVMKRLTIIALVALLALPAAALAAFDSFSGEGTDDDSIKVNFDLRGKSQLEAFKAKKVRYKCNERDTFRANPPEFPSDIDVDNKGKFDDSYSLTDKESGVQIKFKGKVEGKMLDVQENGRRNKKDRHGNRNSRHDTKAHYNKAKGTMEFHARYKEDGDRCESKSIDWKATVD
ncbi:MAG: hypothetical protein QOG62_188 [Thermoleophilaceae bacterium]|jgi:hypothetical protein|nr:hypothetical protein [Thermoleophilaceae bacterium]